MRVIRLVLMIVFVIAALGVMPQAAQAAGNIQCDGNLYLTVTLNPNNTYYYRVTGTGPGLPTSAQLVQGNPAQSVTSTISFVVSGPGAWSGLTLEFSSDGATWFFSSFNTDLQASCLAIGCAAVVPIPSTAVGGAITDNAAVFQMADPNTMTNIVLELGKTFWMDGVDSTGMFRQVLISCEWVWVEAAKTGPNYDEVWNGTPLPSHVVD